MVNSIMDKSPEMASFLVGLHDQETLTDLVKNISSEGQMKLLGAVSDLFSNALSLSEQEAVADILIPLMRKAEMELRCKISKKLAKLDNVPLRLVLHLVNENIDIAEPILKESNVLSDLDLIYIIKSQGAEYWRTIAAREGLQSNVINALADTKDIKTALTLSKNERIILTRYASEILGNMAVENCSIADSLAYRKDFPKSLIQKIYAYVSDDIKTYIDAHFTQERSDITLAFENVVDSEIRAHKPNNINDFEVSLEDADTLDVGIDYIKDIEPGATEYNFLDVMYVLRTSNIYDFMLKFADFCGIPYSAAQNLFREKSAKRLCIICKAYDVPNDEFSEIYKQSNSIRNKGKMLNHEMFVKTMDHYRQVDPVLAKRVIKLSKNLKKYPS